jgi:hypothetical protein
MSGDVPVRVAKGSQILDGGRRLKEGDRMEVPMRLVGPMLAHGFVELDVDDAE